MRLVGKKMSREVGGEVERGMKIDEHNFAVAYHVGMVWAVGALGRGRFGPWAVGALGQGTRKLQSF